MNKTVKTMEDVMSKKTRLAYIKETAWLLAELNKSCVDDVEEAVIYKLIKKLFDEAESKLKKSLRWSVVYNEHGNLLFESDEDMCRIYCSNRPEIKNKLTIISAW